MQAFQFDRIGHLDNLRLVEISDSQTRPGGLAIEVRVANPNSSDAKNALGPFRYTPLPQMPDRDFASIVVIEGPDECLTPQFHSHVSSKVPWRHIGDALPQFETWGNTAVPQQNAVFEPLSSAGRRGEVE